MTTLVMNVLQHAVIVRCAEQGLKPYDHDTDANCQCSAYVDILSLDLFSLRYATVVAAPVLSSTTANEWSPTLLMFSLSFVLSRSFRLTRASGPVPSFAIFGLNFLRESRLPLPTASRQSG